MYVVGQTCPRPLPGLAPITSFSPAPPPPLQTQPRTTTRITSSSTAKPQTTDHQHQRSPAEGDASKRIYFPPRTVPTPSTSSVDAMESSHLSQDRNSCWPVAAIRISNYSLLMSR